MATLLEHVTPHRLRDFANVEQTPARDQLCAAMIRGAVHADNLLVIAQAVVLMIKQLFQTFEGINLAKL